MKESELFMLIETNSRFLGQVNIEKMADFSTSMIKSEDPNDMLWDYINTLLSSNSLGQKKVKHGQKMSETSKLNLF